MPEINAFEGAEGINTLAMKITWCDAKWQWKQQKCRTSTLRSARMSVPAAVKEVGSRFHDA
jgi:hypothetical protein